MQNRGNAETHVGATAGRSVPTAPVKYADPKCASCRTPHRHLYDGVCWPCKTRAASQPPLSSRSTPDPVVGDVNATRPDHPSGNNEGRSDPAAAKTSHDGTVNPEEVAEAPSQRNDPPPHTAPPTTAPAYVQQIVDLMVATEAHSLEQIRVLRKNAANALRLLDKAYRAWATVHTVETPHVPTVPLTEGRQAAPQAKDRLGLTTEDIDRMVRRYAEGATAKQIAAETGVSTATVLNRLRARGVTIRGRGANR